MSLVLYIAHSSSAIALHYIVEVRFLKVGRGSQLFLKILKSMNILIK